MLLGDPLVGAVDRPRKLGVALLGLGNYANSQLRPALKLTEYCRLAGVVTGSAQKGQGWARNYGFSDSSVYHYDEMDRLADDPEIDIVYVVTPNALHAEHAIKAAEAGKHVICEKPFTVSVAEADEVIAVCRDMGVKLSLGYRLHFDPFHEVLRESVRSGAVGPYETMDTEFSFMMKGRPWRAIKSLAGGGPLMDLGVYLIQEACMATGEIAPVAVSARQLPKMNPEVFQDVEETLEFTLEFPEGQVCQAKTSYHGRANRFRADAPRGWFEISPAFGYQGQVAATHRGPVVAVPVNQQALQMDDFARCILDDRESIIGGKMGRRDMVIIEAIYRAMETGERVPIIGA